ncbi:chromosomal replication initiator protein DnaA [Humidesulfovibrio mexicanus]|uniref:Chromosomal replication initiator protein DnaA n=1 Tax=Humidesulfovibrio mexicanus TaxID=147047 RepID=A0A238ZUW0_9BACT|nr:DnaA/Hda family protein [Humidesulfovibrio mexicanus]SNR86453.1 chromosomal replication initiator protein DnaA [Humidesulfovibrio mexicanus]
MKKALREHLSASCTEQELKRWFDPLDIRMSGGGDEVQVAFPHSYFAQWFAGKMQDRFEAELFRFQGHPCDIRYLAPAARRGQMAANASQPGDNGSGLAHNAMQPRKLAFPFDAQYSFESFLTNSKNFFPLETARQVARSDNAQFNPFVICGKSGSGKSHLLKAIANEVAKTHPLDSILVTTGEGLRSLLSPEQNQLSAREHLCRHRFLLVDDIHWLAGDERLQQELLVIFNIFQDARKQMVFTCQERIGVWEDMLPALRSRLEGGLVVGLKQPDMEVRVALIQDRVRAKKLPLSKEQVLTLAQRFQNFRALGGILIKLLAFRELVRRDISARDFEQILSNTEERDQPKITVDVVIDTVCQHYQVSKKDVLGEDRRQNIALARQVAMYLCRQMLGLSYPALGRSFGGKDHSTVIYSVKKIHEMQEDTREMKQLLKDLKLRCRQPA